jgi:hypothetical protein
VQHTGRLSLFHRQPANLSRKTYRLKFTEDGLGLPKEIEFEAHDAATALTIAHKEANDRSAELWCNGQKLCTIKRAASDFWEIRPA